MNRHRRIGLYSDDSDSEYETKSEQREISLMLKDLRPLVMHVLEVQKKLGIEIVREFYYRSVLCSLYLTVRVCVVD